MSQRRDWVAPVGRLLALAGRWEAMRAGPAVVARAPGRLDVMGGIADYTGSLVCELPLAVGTAALVQRRDDGLVVCRSGQMEQVVRLPVDAVVGVGPGVLRAALGGPAAWARYPLGCLWWLAEHAPEAVAGGGGGVTLLVDGDVPPGAAVSSSAAMEVATMMALAGLFEVPLGPMPLAVACQVVEHRVALAPCGLMDQATVCLGRAGWMLLLRCQEDAATGWPARRLADLAVPAGLAVVGVHSGVTHAVAGDPYGDTRTAAFMARAMLAARWPEAVAADGYLANVDPVKYDALWREALPGMIDGGAFVDRFGSTGDPVTTVDPAKGYAVRPAADHHVREAERVRRFVALLGGGGGGSGEVAVEAGTLMLESHESYRDCARLGHPMTDRLVEAVMALGPGRGFFGARSSGGGCGGTVVVLMRDGAEQRVALDEIRAAYSRQTGLQTLVFDGSSAGAAAFGAQVVNLGVRS